jgi:hypothetical protein
MAGHSSARRGTNWIDRAWRGRRRGVGLATVGVAAQARRGETGHGPDGQGVVRLGTAGKARRSAQRTGAARQERRGFARRGTGRHGRFR